MKIGIIDADLIGRSKHRFPNLASMKISGYYKSLGNDVSLLLDYENLNKYDKVFISKVFTDTYVPQGVLNLNNVEYGGTGFFYDKAIPLPYEIEHHMPDYSLYDEWVKIQLDSGTKKSDLTYYIDYSIGFTTRGCFRKCGFDRNDIYDENFWKKDIEDTFERIKVLMRYNCLPYIMRHENYNNSPYRGTYVNLARWCNQPNFYKKKSYREFCETNQKYSKKLCAAMRYLQEFENKYPEISKKYFDLRYEDLKEI